jgi:hypothetical protein
MAWFAPSLVSVLIAVLGNGGGGTDLQITTFDPISINGRTYSLSCDPALGDVQDPSGLCEALRERFDVMVPAKPSLICPGAFHSPFVHIHGTLEGQPVETAVPFCDDGEATGLWLSHVAFPRR